MNQTLIEVIHQAIDPFDEEIWIDEEQPVRITYSNNVWISAYELYGYGDPVGTVGTSGIRSPKGSFDKAHERALRGYHDKVFQSKNKVIKNHRKTCFSHK